MRLTAFKRKPVSVFKFKRNRVLLKRKILRPLIAYGAAFAVMFSLLTFTLSYLTTPRLAVLGFHGIVDLQHPAVGMLQNPIAQRMAYPAQDLETVLTYLVRNNYWFLTTQELYDFFIERSHPIPLEHRGQKPIMLSFDDSYKTVHTHVLPLLKRLQQQYGRTAKAVLFINPGTLAKPDRPSTLYLSCQNLREGVEQGFYDVQSHGENHKNLVSLSASDLNTELAQAQLQLRQCLAGIAPEQTVAAHVAYPYGATNSLVETYAAKYYQSGYLYDSKILRFRWLTDRYAISRLSVNREKSIERVIQLASRSSAV